MKKLSYEYSDIKTNGMSGLTGYFEDAEPGVFDIETTGLNPERNSLILIGFFKNGKAYQYFAENILEEGDIIEAFLKDLGNKEVLITYNGASFDIPFLRMRMEANGISDADLGRIYNLDVYQIIRYYSPLNGILPDLKQKTVERYMGLSADRADSISGAESIGLYFDYVRNGNIAALKKILLHNRDDIIQLYRLLGVLKGTDLNKYFYTRGIPVAIETERGRMTYLTADKIRFNKGNLEVSGFQRYNSINYAAFGHGETEGDVRFDSMTGNFSLKIPAVVHGRMDEIFVVDIEKIGMNCEIFKKYPQFSEGLLMLKRKGEVFELQVNMFIKEYIRHIFREKA